MHSIRKDLEELRRQLEKGTVPRAYRALLAYMMDLRRGFQNNFANSTVSGLYQGEMDVTFFAFFPPLLKRHNLKVVIAFNYGSFRFEAWLAGRNQDVQRQYWELLKAGQWPKYRLVTPAKGIYSILECDLAEDFDLDDPDSLTASIETITAGFIDDIEGFLSDQQPLELTDPLD